jgi:hypothetical protein
MFYLYLKIHNITGLKYLGYTSKDPYKYLGSGKYWLKHIKKHGKDITTQVLCETESKDLITNEGKKYSALWNIVESTEFANMTIEEGTGGSTFKGKKHTPESLKKMSLTKLGKQFTESHKKNLSESNKGKFGKENNFYGKQHSVQTKQLISKKLTGKVRTDEFKDNLSAMYLGKPKPIIKCPHCDKEGGLPQMKRYHFDNCKRRK